MTEPLPCRTFKELFEEMRRNVDYYEFGLKMQITEEILRVMAQKNVNQTELGKRLGVNRAYISRLFKGKDNMTLRTIARIGFALGIEWEVASREK